MAHPADTRPPPSDTSPRHEADDIRVGPVIWFGVGLFVLAMVTHLAIAGAQSWLREQTADQSMVPEFVRDRSTLRDSLKKGLIRPPVLQERDRAELLALRAEEERLLTTYGWINREKGTVRIPVAQAMELMTREVLEPDANREKR